MSACAMVIIFATLVAFDSRVREEVTMSMSGARASAHVAAAQAEAHGLVSVVVSVAREQSQQHGPLMIFLGAAMVLTVFMLRT